MLNIEKVQRCSARIRTFLEWHSHPRVGIVLGTGLGGIAKLLEGGKSIAYAELPDYPLSTVDSHSGRFSLGHLSGVPVMLQEGRCHLYEGYSPEEVVMGARIMADMGAETIIITNAAGALNPLHNAGEIMLIDDHINFTGQSPLTGIDDQLGSRFVDMSMVYDPQLGGLAEECALQNGITLRKGVYLGLQGPQMETRAETRMFRQWGADAVGMSTVMEVIAARHMGMRVLGLSALSNKNLPDCMEKATLEDIIKVSAQAAGELQRLILKILEKI